MSGDQIGLNSPELLERLRAAIERPPQLDPSRSTPTTQRRLRSGNARADDFGTRDPLADAIRKRLGIRGPL